MRSILLGLASLSAFSNTVMAERKKVDSPELASLAKTLAETPKANQQKLLDHNARILADSKTAYDAVKKDLEAINKESQRLQNSLDTKLKQARASDRRWGLGSWGIGDKDEDVLELEKEAKEAELAVAKHKNKNKPTLELLSNEAATAFAKWQELEAAQAKDQVKRDAVDKDVASDLKKIKKALIDQGIDANLKGMLSDVKTAYVDLNNLDTKMQLLEVVGDNMRMGGYFREKLARILNDGEAICDSMKNCGKAPGDKKPVNLDHHFHDESGKLGQKRGGGSSGDTH